MVGDMSTTQCRHERVGVVTPFKETTDFDHGWVKPPVLGCLDCGKPVYLQRVHYNLDLSLEVRELPDD